MSMDAKEKIGKISQERSNGAPRAKPVVFCVGG